MIDLISEVESYVFKFFSSKKEILLYHNYDHTLRVVKFAENLANHLELNEEDKSILKVAGFFHDTGYIISPKDHEEKSVEICIDFLETLVVDQEFIDKVKATILSTKLGVEPTTLLEKIIKDSDCGHITHKDFIGYSDLLRRELEAEQQITIAHKTWIETTLTFLNRHRFYTEYAKDNWQELKEKTIFKLLKEKDKIDVSSERNEKPEKGIETAFRVSLKNHMKLSDIADAKANILLSVNAIIISVALSILVPKLDNPTNGHLIFPTIVLIGFSIIAMIFSILSTRPKVTQGFFTKEDIKNRTVNLLFFGNFHSVSLKDFTWGMHEMMNDKEYLYDSMIKDLYFLGKVLHKKYNILRITYNIFLVGLLISIAAFALMFKISI
ncbi:Pycsar system effector family protein [Dokdonia sp.]|uniref:Pycsar system effector family protein n=1 Tax=Dokdonia sp. TaxID=2024995 RepID=UPI003263FEE9